MVRLLISVAVAVSVITAVAVSGLSGPVVAQDRTDERLSELETRVAELTRRVEALEGDRGGRTAPASDDGADASSGDIRWSGSGEGVSEGFRLSPGRYRVSATVSTSGFDGFACSLYGPGDYWKLVFNELIDAAGAWTGEAVVEVETVGEYYLETSNTGADWEIIISPL